MEYLKYAVLWTHTHNDWSYVGNVTCSSELRKHTHTHTDWSCVGKVTCSSELRKMYMHQEVYLDV